MSVRRVMGSETEFGVLAVGEPHANATVLSTRVVTSYALRVARELSRESSGRNGSDGQTSVGTGWDYGSEAPLSDARGYTMSREQAHPSQLTDQAPVLTAEEIAAEAITESAMYTEDMDWRKVIMNTVIPNGARVYVDHSHPEYSSPEVTTPLDALTWDAAGDVVAARAVAELARGAEKTGTPAVNLYKNNTDNKSVSYGAHENYMVDRAVPFDRITSALLPFFATRQIMCGAGRVGLGVDGSEPGFQLSQRADFFERTVGLETTIHRPIVNTRDEPHALATKFRRLHVIVGDANMSQFSNFLKLGMTKLVLDCIEADVDFSDLRLANAVDEIKQVSHDPTCTHRLLLVDGRRLTAIELLREYRERAAALPDLDEVDAKVLRLWGEVLDDLERDPLSTADRLDWTAKWALISRYLERGVPISDPKLKLIDIQYADIDPAKSLYHALVCKGQMRTLVDEEAIRRAVTVPPEDSRAWFRGKVSEKFGEAIIASSWQSVLFAVGDQPIRFPMDEVDGLTRAEVGELIERAETVESLLKGLESHHV